MSAPTKSTEELIRKLRELSKAPVTIQPALVASVDSANMTCTVTLFDDTEIPDVRLKASIDEIPDTFTKDGLVQVPEEGSAVLVAMIGNENGTRYILAFSEVIEVLLYGGLNGGLVKVTPLVSKLNALENKVNALITWGGTVSPPFSPSTQLTTTTINDLQNIKVKH